MAATIFLTLTDYISGSELCEVSPEILQTIVCGADGFKLDRIRQLSGAEIVRFVSAPFPGFHVSASLSTQAQSAVVYLEEIMKEIGKVAMELNSSTCSNSSVPRRKTVAPAKAKRSSFKDAFYHPLYSESQYHLMPALLPTPAIPSPSTPQPMSDEDCERILSSPYLVGLKNRAGASPKTPTPSAPNTFDKELEGCLPGVPGVRQSKDYKRIRRKISEIDELVSSGAVLDACQKSKVARRPEYVGQLRHMLLHGIPEEHETPTMIEEVPELHLEPEAEPPKVQDPIIAPPVKKHSSAPKKKTVRTKTPNTVVGKQTVSQTFSEIQRLESRTVEYMALVLSVLDALLAVLYRWGSVWSSFFIGDQECPPPPRLAKRTHHL